MHLLEDEFAEIRKETIKIIHYFGEKSSVFRESCRECLFCMLNDESDEVRIEGLKTLRELFESLQVTESEQKFLLFNV